MTMPWDEVEDALRNHIETQWALSSFSTIQLIFENEIVDPQEKFIFIDIQGTYADKSVYGSTSGRLHIEGGIVYIHCFAPSGGGKRAAVSPVVAMTAILELQTVANVIKLEGGNPPSPTEQREFDPSLTGSRRTTRPDSLLPIIQPSGNYYRVSGSVPFIVI